MKKNIYPFIIGIIVLVLSMGIVSKTFADSTNQPSDQIQIYDQTNQINEGDMISAMSDPDIYIVNEHGYKRLFLNPVIFSFYGHLGGYANVKTVLPSVRNSYLTTGLFRVVNDDRVYCVVVTGEDTATLHWINTTGAQAVFDDRDFFKKVFVINDREFNWYMKGNIYTSINQCPEYTRFPSPSPTPTRTPALLMSIDSTMPTGATIEQGMDDVVVMRWKVTNTTNTSISVDHVEIKRFGTGNDDDIESINIRTQSGLLIGTSAFGSRYANIAVFDNINLTIPAMSSIVLEARISVANNATSDATHFFSVIYLSGSGYSAQGITGSNEFTIK